MAGLPRTTIRLRPKNCVRSARTLRRGLSRAVDAVLAVTGHHVLLEANPVLRRSIDVRNPYVDPINLVQVELLRRCARRTRMRRSSMRSS